MLPDPLHPALVHFPVVLAVLVPLAALAAVLLARHPTATRPAWLVVILLAGGLAGTSWLAIETGEREEDRVEEILTSEAALSRHEARADQFLAMGMGVFGLSLVGLASGRIGRVGRTVAALASLVLVPGGLRVGHSGGELVYVHGAAQAYTGSSAAIRAASDRQRGEESEPGSEDR